MASIRRLDPSRTGMIRRRFISELNKRFNKLIKAIYTEIVTEDVFGLTVSKDKSQAQKAGLQTLQYRAYQFLTTPQKMRAFQNWLQIQIDTGILSVSGGITGQPWTGTYIESAYKKAAMDAYVDANKKDLLRSAGWIQGSRESFLRTAFAQPEMLSKIELLSTRAFQQLQGITATMSQQISVSLANGLSHGWSPMKIARDIQKTVSDINRVRARRIARTEIINAHAEGQLDAFEQMGFKEVGVIAELEFTTAGDALVCEICSGLEGQTFTIDAARGIIPVHPNCYKNPNTKIKTKNGIKNICDIQIGDLVYTHIGHKKKVINVFKYSQDNVELVKIYKKSGITELTANHPVMAKKSGIDYYQWTESKNLNIGDEIISNSRLCPIKNNEMVTEHDTDTILNIEKRIIKESITLYNFSVEEDESYIADNLLVHNCCCSWTPVVKS